MNKHPITMPAVAFVPQKDPKFRVLFISEDTFCGSIYFLLGATPERFKTWMKEIFDREDKDASHYFTTEVHARNGATVDVIAFRDEVWDWDIQQMATLVHECHHATSNMLFRKGLAHTRETEEVWAYLQDSIYQRICWALKNPAKVAHMDLLCRKLYPPRRQARKRTLAKKRGKK